MVDPTKRFTNRVENYAKYRPRYPSAIIPLLAAECGLTSESLIADIGSGTGFLSELFLKNENRVVGVEPNAEMRAAGDQILADYPNFKSLEGTAESTGLADASVDFVTVGQAFHWFEQKAARREFERILKPQGWVVIVWNGFQVDKNPVVTGYQQVLLRYGTDYRGVAREIADTEVEKFFSPGNCKSARFEFQQYFDFEGYKGRVLSASFAPEPGQPNYEPLIEELRQVFQANEKDGKVVFDYDTEVYYGQLG
ncbi:MAG TPA: class I SAM-dependent methyltransferase [Pyrinomonadaceae bacterium]|nr:class I SAM-dependent methyltransferase [Pyrinomonadaceae bacterium]